MEHLCGVAAVFRFVDSFASRIAVYPLHFAAVFWSSRLSGFVFVSSNDHNSHTFCWRNSYKYACGMVHEFVFACDEVETCILVRMNRLC